MRVRFVGRGSLPGLNSGSDITVLIVPEETFLADPKPEWIPIDVRIDPKSVDPTDPDLIFEVPDAG